MLSREYAALERVAQGVPLHEALDGTDPGDWVGFDIDVRAARWADHDVLAGRGTSEPAFALCHHDGRVREEALERAAALPELVPLVVIRTADWAAPVRERARALLPPLLAATAPEALAPLTALVLHVARRERGAFARDTLAALVRSAALTDLEPLLAAEDRGTRRFAHGIAVERGLLSPVRLARTAAADADTVVQHLCAEAALVHADAVGDAVIEPLLGSRQPGVRAVGVTALRKAGRHAEARPYLTDRSGLVRACARYVLRQGGVDPLPLYRALCADPGDPGIPGWAPLGLAECGGSADAALLWPLVGHPVPAVRARAIAGLRVLDRADTERLRPLLDDPAPAVARETVSALLPSARRLPEEWLARRLDASRPVHTRRAAFRLLRARGGVVQLRAAVRLLDDEDPSIRALAGPTIQQWDPPVGEDHDPAEVAALLDRCTHLFSDDVMRRLRWRCGIEDRNEQRAEAPPFDNPSHGTDVRAHRRPYSELHRRAARFLRRHRPTRG
ncbi:hypothetical protein [Streptomyces sp. MS1.AVA.4]|uniref:Uncharacterized protein n=1 Tax=Streptomyces pratisoli TaxID=3139917 RepID=A0ACC6QC59_9ACTN